MGVRIVSCDLQTSYISAQPNAVALALTAGPFSMAALTLKASGADTGTGPAKTERAKEPMTKTIRVSILNDVDRRVYMSITRCVT